MCRRIITYMYEFGHNYPQLCAGEQPEYLPMCMSQVKVLQACPEFVNNWCYQDIGGGQVLKSPCPDPMICHYCLGYVFRIPSHPTPACCFHNQNLPPSSHDAFYPTRTGREFDEWSQICLLTRFTLHSSLSHHYRMNPLMCLETLEGAFGCLRAGSTFRDVILAFTAAHVRSISLV